MFALINNINNTNCSSFKVWSISDSVGPVRVKKSLHTACNIIRTRSGLQRRGPNLQDVVSRLCQRL